MEKALVIFSGGQDSTTCLYWAFNRFDEVEAITFDYGQKHSVEIEQSKMICKLLNIQQTIIDISFLNTIVESALISSKSVNKINENGLPDSFVPNRNQLFITLAHSYAQKIGCQTLVGGMCETDFSGYPDCRQNFIDNLLAVTNEGSGINNKPALAVIMRTPLMFLTKAETFMLAQAEGCLYEVIKLSHTCYNGSRTMNSWGAGCGECPACKLREKGYNEYLKM